MDVCRNGNYDGFGVALEARKKLLLTRKAKVKTDVSELQLELSQLEEQISHIDALLGPVSGGDSHDVVLEEEDNAHPLTNAVVSLIRENGAPMHYRQIYESLREQGMELPVGKDPATTLLARYYKDDRLYRPTRGSYDLRNGRKVVSVGTKRNRTRRKN